MTVLPDLRQSDPADLVGTVTPAQLAAALRRLGDWDERATACAHQVMTVWTQAAITRPDDREGIGELQRVIHQSLHPIGDRPAPPEWLRERWAGYAEILEARRLEIAHRDPERIVERKWVAEILNRIGFAKGTVYQADIVGEFDLSPGGISQVLAVMESHGLIETRKEGRRNRLSLAASGKQLLAASATRVPAGANTTGSREDRPAKPSGITYLTLAPQRAAA